MSQGVQIVSFEPTQLDCNGADKSKNKNQHLERHDTEEGGFVRTNTTLSHDQKQLTQASQLSQVTPPLKQNNCFPKLSFHVIGQPDTSYYINSNANVTSFKSNLLMFSQRCPSPEEKLPQVLYDTPTTLQIPEQSIKKYTRRKSCQGGLIFGEPSMQNIQREKQFPLAIIRMHLKQIIMEAEKKKKEKSKEKPFVKQQSKRSFLHTMPKQQSFKNTMGKSLFNAQMGSSQMSPIPSPLAMQTNQQGSGNNNYVSQNSQTIQKLVFNSQKTLEVNNMLEKKISGGNGNSSPDKAFQQKQASSNENYIQHTAFNKTNTLQPNQNQRIVYGNNNQTSEGQIAAKLRQDSEEQQISQVGKSTSKAFLLEEGNEGGAPSKLDLQSINSIKIEPEDKKRDRHEHHIEGEDQSQEKAQHRPIPIITMSLSKCKQSDQDSNSSFSNTDLDEDNEDYLNECERRSNATPKSKKKNSQLKSDRISGSLKIYEGSGGEQEGQRSVTFSNTQSSQNNFQQTQFHRRQIPKYSVVNVVAPTQQQQMARKQQLLSSKTLMTSQTDLNNESQSKNDQTKRHQNMNNNIKQIQENQDLQDIVQEYLEPGSTENIKYSPSNPSNRIGNMKKVFMTATNWIALQNRVKANNTFYRNYYNLIGKVSVENSIQYLSQMADDILSTPANRKVTQVFCAPKKRKVFIHNSIEDKVKLITSFDKRRLNSSVQRYVIDKQNQIQDGQSVMQDGMNSTIQSSSQSQFYKSSDYFHSPEISKFSKTHHSPDYHKQSKTHNSHYSDHQFSKSLHNHDYLLHENQNSINRRIQHLGEYQKKKNKKNLKVESLGNQGEFQGIFNEQIPLHKKHSSSTKNLNNNSKKSSISFFDKLNNNNSYYTSSAKTPLSPYLLPCTPNSATNSKSKEIKILHQQLQSTKRSSDSQRFHQNNGNINNLQPNTNNTNGIFTIRKSSKNNLHS